MLCTLGAAQRSTDLQRSASIAVFLPRLAFRARVCSTAAAHLLPPSCPWPSPTRVCSKHHMTGAYALSLATFMKNQVRRIA